MPVEIPLLVSYNAVFVAPVAAIIAIRRLAPNRTERWIAATEARLQYIGQLALAGVATAAGSVLLVIGITGILFS